MNIPVAAETIESNNLAKLRVQISNDIESLREKEASLREYEQRLRQLVEHAHSNPPLPTGPSAAAPVNLDAEWEKYRRANALLEAARRSMAEDRLALKDREEKLGQRENELSRREKWVQVREQELESQVQAVALARAQEAAKRPTLTTAPFLAARNLLSLGRTR